MTIVTTKEELKKAQNASVEKIIVSGELAEKLHKAKKITPLGTVAMGGLIAATTIGISFNNRPFQRL